MPVLLLARDRCLKVCSWSFLVLTVITLTFIMTQAPAGNATESRILWNRLKQEERWLILAVPITGSVCLVVLRLYFTRRSTQQLVRDVPP